MGTRVRKIHIYICATLWSAWFIGMLLLLVAFFAQFFNEQIARSLFFSIVLPYNKFVLICSFLPIEPLAFIVALIHDMRSDDKVRNIRITVLYFLITLCIWFIYVGLNIVLTGI